MTPKISVCLLTFNHKDVIEAAVRSVLAQDEPDFELILSDDCSRDGTWEVLEALAASDPRIRVVRTPRNLGMAGNANFAAKQARALYMALLHHDDVYDASLLRKWVSVAERHPNVAFVSNSFGEYGSSEIERHPFAETTPGRVALEQHFLPAWGCPVRGTALIRRSCWEQVGGMREEFGMLADVDLWMRLSRQWDFGYVPEPLVIVRQERPDDYPSAYKSWSWARQKILYEIHGTNRAEYFTSVNSTRERRKFRVRVSINEMYWLAYAVAKRRTDMLLTSDSVANSYELLPVKLARKALRSLASTQKSRKSAP